MEAPSLNKILYVEDDLDIQTIAKIALEEIGNFEVKYCSSGLEALEQTKFFKPDLIILDVMMPGMDGPTTLKELRNKPEFSSTPVIFMTAKTQSSEIAEYLKMGAIDFIAKPFDPMTLASSIREIWDRYFKSLTSS